MIVPQSPIVSTGVLERELGYLSPRGTNGERAGEMGGLSTDNCPFRICPR